MNKAVSNIHQTLGTSATTIRITTLHSLLKNGLWQTESPRGRRSHLFLWVTKGQGRIAINGRSRGFAPNTLVFVPTGCVYGFQVSKNVQGFALFVPGGLGVRVPVVPAQIKAQSIFEQGEVTSYFDNLSKEALDRGNGAQRVMESYVTLLGVWVERAFDRNEYPGLHGADGAAKRLVEKFLLLMDEKFRLGLPVSHYAAALCVTPTHLSRVCSQVCNKPASALQTDRILLEAKLLLQDTDMRMGDISKRIGLSSPAYFSRLFTKTTGQTPKKFRATSRAL